MADDALIIGVHRAERLTSSGLHELIVDEALVGTLDLHVVGLDHSLNTEHMPSHSYVKCCIVPLLHAD